ncbi:hypothetical protein IAE35_06150 [Pseudomonas sp. S75]|uniref:hypothetical protein n=1 Tax=unclassified Pseudomonas TaxID=196821 RepID=UPI001906246C|nr:MULTISPECIES: hypothetical protein [unclassified Pseudomonas]MBJ9975079.1 hypothetical protein [Pseudomonas sp. S30]MBK0152916.1 hypothetical protein [Pseudomonas sp. S75]
MSAIILLPIFCFFIFLIVESPKKTVVSPPDSTQPVCGRVFGKTISVPRHYVMFWAEYEGESSWDKETFRRHTGCAIDLVSLPMVVSWPDFQPPNQAKYFQQGLRFEGLDIVLTPTESNGFDLRSRLNFLLGRDQEGGLEPVEYVESLGLYLTRRQDKTFPENTNEYYWREEDGDIQAVFECLGGRNGGKVYSCQGEFFLEQLASKVAVGFTPDKLDAWKKIIDSTKTFVLSNIVD